MCFRRRFKKALNTTVAAGSKELVLDLEERCCVRQLVLGVDMDDSTGTNQSRWIIKVDEDEVLNESIVNMYYHLSGYGANSAASRYFNATQYTDTSKAYTFVILDLGRVERRFAVFFENKDTSNSATVYCGVIYDILEDEK